MTQDRFLHILRFLHFADNSQTPDGDKEHNWLWKLRTVFDKLNEVTVKFKGRVIFRQYIPKKRNLFNIKIYTLCDESGYTYDMRVYLGRDSHSATDDMTAIHATVRHLTSRVKRLRTRNIFIYLADCTMFPHLPAPISKLHNLLPPFTDHFFSSPRLSDDLDRRKINSCGAVQPTEKTCPATLNQNKWNWKGVTYGWAQGEV